MGAMGQRTPLKLLLEDKYISFAWKMYLVGGSLKLCLHSNHVFTWVGCLFGVIGVMGLMRIVGIFASPKPPLGCYSEHGLAPQYGSETGFAVFLEMELINWLSPRNSNYLFHFYIYRHLFAPVCILCPSFANLQITNFASKRTTFFCRYPLYRE